MNKAITLELPWPLVKLPTNSTTSREINFHFLGDAKKINHHLGYFNNDSLFKVHTTTFVLVSTLNKSTNLET